MSKSVIPEDAADVINSPLLNRETHSYRNPMVFDNDKCDHCDSGECESDRPDDPSEELDRGERIMLVVNSQNMYRDAYRHAILFYKNPATKVEGVEELKKLPEAPRFMIEPYALIDALVECEALEIVGSASSDNGNSSAEDSISRTYAFDDDVLKATEEAIAVADQLSPSTRFDQLMAEDKGREEVYEFILRFCESGANLPDIQQALKDRFSDEVDHLGRIRGANADYYLDSLRRVGMLTWMDEWQLTDAARPLLQR